MSKKQYGNRKAELLQGDEPFVFNGEKQLYSVSDFWSFQYSNLWDYQGDVAEFIIAKALDINEPHNRSGWTLWDFEYRGFRIEVKSTAYFQMWELNGKITANKTYSIRKTHKEQGDITSPLVRNNDIYVFCLLTGETQEESNPLILDNWRFWVIPTSIINAECGDNKTINLNKVKEISKDSYGLVLDMLKRNIDHCIDYLLSTS